jgi:hypothetical protein
MFLPFLVISVLILTFSLPVNLLCRKSKSRPLFSNLPDPILAQVSTPFCVECAGTFDHVTTNVMAFGHVGSKDLSDPNGEGAWENK